MKKLENKFSVLKQLIKDQYKNDFLDPRFYNKYHDRNQKEIITYFKNLSLNNKILLQNYNENIIYETYLENNRQLEIEENEEGREGGTLLEDFIVYVD